MIKKLTLMSVMAGLCLLGNGQERISAPLKVGQYIPDVSLVNVLNSETGTLSLGQFKGKLLILAFWGAQCKSCLSTMPLIDSLQSVYSGSIQFILISGFPHEGNDEAAVKLFEEWKQKGLYVPQVPVTAKEQPFLSELFPHDYVPHYIWINKWGRVSAITTYHLMNAETIESFLRFKG